MVIKLVRRSGLVESFTDTEAYCCQKTPQRVAAVHVVNLNATMSLAAAQEMDCTFRNAGQLKRKAGISARGRKGRKPVLHYVLSWAVFQKPTHAEMFAEAKKSIEVAGYKDHQALLVVHNDGPHPHVHVIVNRGYPVTGVMVKPSYIKLKLSRRAEEYERAQGKIICKKRVVNNRRRAAGQYVKYTPPVIAEAWKRSGNGRGFAVALKRSGHILARGDRRGFVIVNPHGEVQNPTHQIDGVRAAHVRAKLADLDPATLPDVTQAKRQAAQWQRQQALKVARRKARQKATASSPSEAPVPPAHTPACHATPSASIIAQGPAANFRCVPP